MMKIYKMIKDDRHYTQRVLYNIYYFISTARSTNYYHLNYNIIKLFRKNRLNVHTSVVTAIANIIK